MTRTLGYWAAAGFSVPVLVLVLAHLQGGVFSEPRLAIALWPSSIILLGIHEATPFAILASLLSIVLNIVWYAAVGAMIWLFYRLFSTTRTTDDRLRRFPQREKALGLGLTACLDGGLSLFFAYAGTAPMVLAVLLGAITASILIRLEGRRTPAASADRDASRLLMVAGGWFMVLAVVGGLGLVSQAPERAFFEGGIALTALFVIVCLGLSVAGSVALQGLVLQLSALRSRSAGTH